MSPASRPLAIAALAAALTLALAGFALLVLRAVRADSGDSVPLATAGAAAPAAAGRLLCSFSNADARAALIQGSDGGQSIVAGDRTWWLFGDTLFLPQSGKQIEPNAIAWSQRDAPGQCPRLTYVAKDGASAPFIPKDGSLTVWPAGAFAVDGRTIGLYTAYVYGTGPYAYWIGEVGVATLDTATMRVATLARSLWDARSGFPDQVIGAQPVDTDAAGNLRLILQTVNGGHLLARVPRSRIAEAAAYTYWDGRGWSPDAAAAASLWPRDQSTDLVGRLAAFDNGVSVAYNPYLKKYLAVGNVGFDKIGARTADRLEGPWSAPTTWIDCETIARPAVPVCYSPLQHPQLSTDGGRTLFLTFTRMATYDVVAYEITLDGAGPPSPAASLSVTPKGAPK